jgi:hypothetical protein
METVKENCQAKTKERAEKLGNRFWRLNNLYYILNEQGERVLFQLNPVQMVLYFALWWLNIIPKSRQHGITTFVCIFFLDACLFNSNTKAGIIAHKLADAKKIFKDKVRYVYEQLPEDLKAARSLTKDDACALEFSNNSSIYVGTSMRSGTLQYLLVSEYGWTCTHAPQKAAEIKAGALETVHAKGMIFIEATGEGPMGDFPEMCKEADHVQSSGRDLGPLDYKLHFIPWHEKVSNQTDPQYVEIPQKLNLYLDKVEKIYKKKLTLPQRAWYAAKKKTLKHLIFKEHPSFMEEVFIASIEGAYYAAEMAQMREDSRICVVPLKPELPVHTVCDLGVGSHMPWIFFQVDGPPEVPVVRIVNTFCLGEKTDTRGGMPFFKSMLDDYKAQYKYNYGRNFAPFDAKKVEIGTGKTILESASESGVNFCKLERELSVNDGIERTSNLFPSFYIDNNCNDLITALSAYHREWIENLESYSNTPVPDKSSHYADTLRYLSLIIKNRLYVMEVVKEHMPRRKDPMLM